MKKKTFVFDEKVLFTLSEIKQITKKSETQIVKESLRLYRDFLEKEKKALSKNLELAEKLENLVLRLETVLKEISR